MMGKVRNPLNKRFQRELKRDIVRYAVIFVFMTGVIGSVSGFMVANNSLTAMLHSNYERYNMEDGNFETAEKASEQLLRELEQDMEKDGLRLFENFYIETETEEVSSTLRVFAGERAVNGVCLMDGSMPSGEGELAVDRMYAVNNGLSVGDELTLDDEIYKISALLALPDYSALYQNPADMMFDTSKFGVAWTTREGFAKLDEKKTVYNYSWKYATRPQTDIKAKDAADELLEVLSKKTTLNSFIPAYSNPAMRFVENDITKDNSLFQVFLYVVVAIVAFIFAVTTSSTITKEASVIGTLRASGFTRGEMVRHYMAMPVLTLVASASIGNLLGYTVLKDYMVDVYYKSYSLTAYETLWNGWAFVKTTAAPMAIMIINACSTTQKCCNFNASQHF